MAAPSVTHAQPTYHSLCPICGQPDAKSTAWARYDSPNIANEYFVCSQGHGWQVQWLEGQEDYPSPAAS